MTGKTIGSVFFLVCLATTVFFLVAMVVEFFPLLPEPAVCFLVGIALDFEMGAKKLCQHGAYNQEGKVVYTTNRDLPVNYSIVHSKRHRSVARTRK